MYLFSHCSFVHVCTLLRKYIWEKIIIITLTTDKNYFNIGNGVLKYSDLIKLKIIFEQHFDFLGHISHNTSQRQKAVSLKYMKSKLYNYVYTEKGEKRNTLLRSVLSNEVGI